jgi:hypothetical protein
MKEPSKIQRGFLVCLLMPAVILLTPATMIWGMAIQGGKFPMEGMFFGAIGGFVFMLWATAFSVIAWQHQKWLKIKIALIVFLLIDLGWLPVKWYRNYSTRPYSREELAFKKVEPSTADLTGIWQGTWTDPKTSLTESITLDLRQDGNQVEGTITVDRSSQFEIVEGLISGNQINFFYDHSFPEFSRPNGVGTLLGEVASGQLSGTWQAHQRPSAGQARKGPWSARKTSPPSP